MKFIADAMLGRLARWLRLLGFDTLYFPDIEDRRLLRIAREEDRTLLTRDTRLVKVRGLKNFILLHENDPFEQLKRVLEVFNLYPGTHPIFSDADRETFYENMGCVPRLYSRCSLCNTLLEEVPKEQAKTSVPEYVYQTCDNFKKCPQCGKFYWKGTHPDMLKKKLGEILSGK